MVPLHVATSMDAPNPDAGEEHPHTNTQLFGTVAPEDNRFLPYEEMQPPFNAPDDPARKPTMDGFVVDYVNTFRSEMGRLPEYDEYALVMSCYTPEQVPAISTIARGFATTTRLSMRSCPGSRLTPRRRSWAGRNCLPASIPPSAPSHGGWVQLRQHPVPGRVRRARRHL